MTNKGIVTDIHVGDVLANVADIHIVGHRAANAGPPTADRHGRKSVGPTKTRAENSPATPLPENCTLCTYSAVNVSGHPQVAPVVGTAALLCQSIYLVVVSALISQNIRIINARK